MKKELKKKIPELKKTLNAFLVGEEGKISKQSIIKAGVILTAVSLGALKGVAGHSSHGSSVPHSNSLGSLTYQGSTAGTASTSHSHHASHASHASHGSSDPGSGGGGDSSSSSSSTPTNCCFPAGTMVSTPKGDITIEKIKVGEIVLAYDTKDGKEKQTTFKKMVKPIREGICIINKGLIKTTTDHPFYTKKKDGKIWWAAIDNTKSSEFYGVKDVMILQLGDFIMHKEEGWIEITNLEYVRGNIQTYCLFEVDKYKNFFADGFLVHNRGCGWHGSGW